MKLANLSATAKVKNAWRQTSTSRQHFHGVVRDSRTVTFPLLCRGIKLVWTYKNKKKAQLFVAFRKTR